MAIPLHLARAFIRHLPMGLPGPPSQPNVPITLYESSQSVSGYLVIAHPTGREPNEYAPALAQIEVTYRIAGAAGGAAVDQKATLQRGEILGLSNISYLSAKSNQLQFEIPVAVVLFHTPVSSRSELEDPRKDC